jgi:hypothetical protein
MRKVVVTGIKVIVMGFGSEFLLLTEQSVIHETFNALRWDCNLSRLPYSLTQEASFLKYVSKSMMFNAA